MAITAAVVNELRQATGCGLMDCKKALIECEGDMEKAVMYLRERASPLRRRRPAAWLLRAWLTPPSSTVSVL